MHFLEWKGRNFDYNVTWIYSERSNEQYCSIGSDNGLAPAWRQVIIWNNGGYITDAYMRYLASMS